MFTIFFSDMKLHGAHLDSATHTLTQPNPEHDREPVTLQLTATRRESSSCDRHSCISCPVLVEENTGNGVKWFDTGLAVDLPAEEMLGEVFLICHW